uniref:Family with sequence similarity 185 member A n=1 Tax=Sparus aurata TaxID=8175 RepID=A0A671Y7B1_SPAAU
MFWSSAGQRGRVGLLRCWSLTAGTRTLSTPKCPLHTSRLFSISAPSKCPTHAEVKQPLRQWALEVSPFSTVRAQLGCSISVHPLDVHAFPEADRAFISVHGTDTEPEVDLDHLHVRYDDQKKELHISCHNFSQQLAGPCLSDLFITTQGEGNVQVKNMDCDVCTVHTEMGNCLLHSVKAHRVEVQSTGGDVTGTGTIHGNVDISTSGDSAVDVKKLQGTEMNVSTERGPLKVKAIYAESSCVSSCSGRVELGHVHGEQTAAFSAFADGSNNFLKVSSNSGGIDVYVGDGGSAELHSQEGKHEYSPHLCVRVPSSLKAGVELCGASVDISPEVNVLFPFYNSVFLSGYMNGESAVDRWVKARADRGSVRLKTQSWFESLKLGS